MYEYGKNPLHSNGFFPAQPTWQVNYRLCGESPLTIRYEHGGNLWAIGHCSVTNYLVKLSFSVLAAKPPSLPLRGRWHGVSRDG